MLIMLVAFDIKIEYNLVEVHKNFKFAQSTIVNFITLFMTLSEGSAFDLN